MDKQDILFKVQRYCAYQERCTHEVLEKLRELDANPDDFEDILEQLKAENYLNDTRFAEVFAGSKFRLKRWGRNKIIQALNEKRLDDRLIEKALTAINKRDYTYTLKDLIKEKEKELKPKKLDRYTRNYKVAQALMRKGYEPELIWKYLKRPK